MKTVDFTLDDALKRLGVNTIHQRRLYRVILDNEPVSLYAMAKFYGKPLSGVYRPFKKLVKKGLVKVVEEHDNLNRKRPVAVQINIKIRDNNEKSN